MPNSTTLPARIPNGHAAGRSTSVRGLLTNPATRDQRTDTVRRAPVADEPRVSPRIIAAIQTTERNARTLWADGYTLEFVDPINLVYFVRRPEPQVDRRTGEIIREGYVVDLRAQTCECETFAWSLTSTGRGTCKHLGAVDARIRAALEELGLGLPESAPTRWEVVERCPVCGELPGPIFDTEAAAWDWLRRERESARAAGEPVPALSVRSQVIWGEGK